MIIAGGLSFTFLKVLNGMKIGNSIYDEEGAKIVLDIVKKAEEKGVNIHFPSDFVCSTTKDEKSEVKIIDTKSSSGIPDEMSGCDIGPESLNEFTKIIKSSRTCVWNGPVGIFELPPFRNGTMGIIKAMCEASNDGCLTIVGGGESVSSLQYVPGSSISISHISTGGGASLELMEGKKLPGVEYLSNKY
jgi:phosphoglycerate kinase